LGLIIYQVTAKFNCGPDVCLALIALFYPNNVLSTMRDIFTPVFLLVLAALFIVDAAAVNLFIFTQLAVVVVVCFLILFYFNKYK
jgi:hypothetical protein